MIFRRSKLQTTAFAATAAAVLALTPVSSSAADQRTMPVSATTEEVTVNTNCHDYKPGVVMANTKCEILKGGALDAQAKMLGDEKACLKKLLEFQKAFPKKFDELGPISRANACEAAGRIPRPTANASPRMGG